MKFRTLLLASAAVLVAAPAFAQDDITAAFYTPAKGKFLSDTSLAMSRSKMNVGEVRFKVKGYVASEELTYGVTDNLAVFGAIANNFNTKIKYSSIFESERVGLNNNDHNFDYELGVKYNMNYGKVLGQVALSYQTYDPRSWYGKGGEEGERGGFYSTNKWEKILNGEVKLGYVLDCGLTPYTTFAVSDDVTHSAKDKDYSWFLGVHKMLNKVSWDAGVRYDFDSDDNENWYAQAEVNYFVKDNMTVGVYGDYYLGGSKRSILFDEGIASRKDVDYDYTVGLNAKVAF